MKGRANLSVSLGDLQGNQFLQEYSGKGMTSRAYSKDLRVRKLEERNVKLQEEIIKIEKILAETGEKTQYGIRLPEIKSDVMRKQLENAYKMIKQYEYEISKKKKLEFQDTYVEQLRKYQRVLKEKEGLSEKLRKEIAETKKITVEYTKLLKNDSLKREYEEKQITINADIKWLHEKIKRIQAKKNRINSNLQRQLNQIQKMQKDLIVEHEYEKSSIQAIRNRIFNATTNNISQQQEEQSEEQLEPVQQRDDLVYEQRTPQIYSLMMDQVKLYRKLENDYSGKLELLIKEKAESEERNFKSRNRLVQVEYEIDRAQSAIYELKKQIDPKALKPTKMEMIVEEKRRNSQVKLSKPKITMAHSYPFSEIGEATKAGKRFIDRSAIGKKHAKIIEITFFEKKEGEKELLGLQATYLVGHTKKKGLLNILYDASLAQKTDYSLESGDFVRSLDVLTDDKGKVVGISMVSERNVVLKGGTMTPNRHPLKMEPNQYPTCLYGCLLPEGIEMFGVEYVHQE